MNTSVGRLALAYPVMNAAGPWAASLTQLQAIAASTSAAVVTKSFSLQPMVGNQKSNMHFAERFSNH